MLHGPTVSIITPYQNSLAVPEDILNTMSGSAGGSRAPGIKAELTRSPGEIVRRFSALETARDVADLLEIPYSYLNRIVYWGRRRHPYRTFTIKKRSGGLRKISAPPTSLRILQSKLNTTFQLVYRRKPSAHGFITGRSILSNAQRHIGKRFILNLDLENFFPTIHFGRVRGVFMSKPYSIPAPAATVLAQMCCHDGVLPQGAPTSPIVSNMVCAKLDGDLQGLAKKYRCTYTRYADDITFSTTVPKFPRDLAVPFTALSGDGLIVGKELADTIESNDFRINAKKQRLQIATGHQEVTGLTVNKFPNVSRQLVRQIRAMLHAWDVYGLEAAEEEHIAKYANPSRRSRDGSVNYGNVIKGKLAFLSMIKGDADPTYRNLRNHLSKLDPTLIEPAEDWPSIEALALSVQHQRPDIPARAVPGGTITMLFTDIESSTALNAELGDAEWMKVLHEHNEIIRTNLRKFDGYEVKTMGDAFMIAFRSAIDALNCVISFQREFLERNKTAHTPIHVRTGLHTGEPVKTPRDIYGYHVNFASRVAGAAHAGQILVSELLKEVVSPSGHFDLRAEAPIELKGLQGEHTLYSVVWSGDVQDAAADS